MSEQQTQLLEKLAAQLGTTVEYLWAALLKQAPVDAAITVAQYIILIITGVILWKLHNKYMKPIPDDRLNDNMYEKNLSCGVLMAVFGSTWIIVMITAFFSLPTAFSGFYNPEYWAMKHLLQFSK